MASASPEGGRATALEAGAALGCKGPYEALRDATLQGHINAMADSDGVLRHALLNVEVDGETLPSMALQAARLCLEKRGQALEAPSVNARGHIYVPYTGRPGAYYDGASIAALIAGKVPSGYWADKIVLIGAYAPSLQDAFFTSIDHGVQMYGVEFQANVIQSLLEGKRKTELPDWPQRIALFILCFLAMALFLRLRLAHGGGLCAGLAILGPGGALMLYRLGWVAHPLWLPAAALALYLVALVERYIRTTRERRALALEKERLDTELALATRIQANSLPKDFPERSEFSLFASMAPPSRLAATCTTSS